MSYFLNPTGCNCLCHDVDGDSNIDGGCELCEEAHMACPTCDHTMQSVAPEVFWCPRCGTLKAPEVSIPTLVCRCREFGKLLPEDGEVDMELWRRLGIAEAIKGGKP